MAGGANNFFFSCKSGSRNAEGVRFHPVDFEWTKEVQRETAKQVMCSVNAKGKWQKAKVY